MKTFTIQEMEKLSGIHAHTLRTWERRYQITEPLRTASNTRLYTFDDLKRVLYLGTLNANGNKISRLASLHYDDVKKAYEDLFAGEGRKDCLIAELILCMHSLDVAGFEGCLNECSLMWPCEEAVRTVIFPFLQRTELLYRGTGKTEEHLAVTSIRKKLIWCIEQIGNRHHRDKTVALFLPFEKQLDLLLLYLHFELKWCGYRVLYMGSHVTESNVEELAQQQPFDYAITYFHKKNSYSSDELSAALQRNNPATELILLSSGNTIQPKPTLANARAFTAKEALDYFC